VLLGIGAAIVIRVVIAARRARRTLACRVTFAEGLRWRKKEKRLVFSDMHARKLLRLEMNNELTTIMDVDDDPSGLGWLPDGRMLVVLMCSRTLAVVDEQSATLAPWADLSSVQPFRANDMVMDGCGNAYVGGFGQNNLEDPGTFGALTEITLVRAPAAPHSQATTQTAAQHLLFPNGAVITPDGRTFLAAETFGSRISAWDRDPVAATLSNPRVWAMLDGCYPDGMCLDEEGALWVAICGMEHKNRLQPTLGAIAIGYLLNGKRPAGAFARVHEGGKISQCIFLRDELGVSCMLGGADGRTLYMSCARSADPVTCKRAGDTNGCITTATVAVPGAQSVEFPYYWAGYC